MRPIPFLLVGAMFLAIGFTASGVGVEAEAEAAPDERDVAAEARLDAPSDPPVDDARPTIPEEDGDEDGEATRGGTAGETPAPETREAAREETPEVRVADDDARRRRWRSRRYRFPAPDFTPAEWRPPEGPVRIALQAGHWRAHEAPDELDGLRTGGTHAAGLAEWEVNLALAERTGEMLRDLGYEVDILPAVVPPDYHAHLFIAIHADGAADPAARGFRIAAPDDDYTGRAQEMVDLLGDSYERETGLRRLPDATRRMRRYYAFNVRRYEHSLDPRTIALILETGFLTSPTDRAVIVDEPDRVARGIVEAVKAFPVTALPVAPAAPAAVPATAGR